MKIIFSIFLFMILTGCSRQSKPADDYVLIEFASKLEEDYQKLLPPPVNEKKVDP